MDAPTTTSADNGTSGDNDPSRSAGTPGSSGTSGDSGGGGWFSPRRKRPAEGRTGPGPAGDGPEGTDGTDRGRISVPSRSFAAIRPVGSGARRSTPPPGEANGEPVARPDGARRPAPEDAVPDAFRPRDKPVGDGDEPAHHPAVPEGAGAPAGNVGEPFPEEVTEVAARLSGGLPGAESPGFPPEALVQPGSVRPESLSGGAGTGAGRPPGAMPPESLPTSPPEPTPAPTPAPNPDADADGEAEPAPHPAPDRAGEQPSVSAALPPEAQAAPGALPPEAPAPQPSAVVPPTAAPPADTDASPDAIIVRRTLSEIEPVSDQLTSYFYALLFIHHPELRGLFPVAMDTQRDRLLKSLFIAAEHMDSPVIFTDYLRQLGRGHRKYGTQSLHYPAVGEALIGALTRYATIWDDETEGAWVRTYTAISQIMIDAAAENEQYAPAWWNAEVVAHQLRTPDVAVVTVRPDQPYPFRAGQYTSVETPWWPRVWRHYSFASAPRPDGLLTFHVKAVPAGWVSNSLVHHASPGDILRLGPPAGSMVVDHSTDNGLLCLGGGTGIAPIKALVEDVAEHGHRRRVEVFYGARSDQELYDMETMLRLQSEHTWLSVRPVVGDGRPGQGLTERLPDVVRDYGPWEEYDAYLSGPPGMIRSGLDVLTGIGIPSERIRHDSLDALVAT
ncbi:globin domain-containing protein [Streptomyces sp. NPDC001780]